MIGTSPTQYPAFRQRLYHLLGQICRFLIHRVQVNFRRLRKLIRRIEAGEIFDLAGLCLGIKAFRIATDAFIDWGIDEYFEEFSLLDQTSHHVALGAVGRDERAQYDEPALQDQFRYFTD